MTSFRQKLKEIRTAQEATARGRRRLTDEELGLGDGTEQVMAERTRISRRIERLMRDFMKESGGFTISRGFFEGKYSLALSCDELCLNERGEMDKCFSRIHFLLDAHSVEGSIEETTKITILNKDLPKATCKASFDSEDQMTELERFQEGEMLRFAEAYFEGRKRVPVQS